MILFNGEVAIVTGGATGIGEAISKTLALEGARVVVAGLPDDPVEAVVAEIKARGGTKGYLIAFARGLALEQAPYGVRANVVCPGATMTQWHDTDVSSMTDEMEEQIAQAIPMSRHADPEEIANVFAFVASKRASFVTGALYFTDGGVSIARGTPGAKVPDALRQPPTGTLHLEHQMEGMDNMDPHRAS